MKNTPVSAIAIFICLFFLGCASPHKITLTDGSVIQTKNEPKFDGREEFYKFKNESGKNVSVNRDEVRKIEKQ